MGPSFLWLASLALAAPQATLARSSTDVAATQALSRAAKTLLNASLPDLPKGLANVRNYADEIATQCPKVAAESPQNYGAEQLDYEVAGAMTVVGYRTATGPIGTFYRAVKGLHWSNPKLTRAVSTFATKLDKLVGLTVPSLCGDVKEWVASGYKTLATSTTQFLRRYNAVDPEAEEGPLIMRLARPYATASDVPLFRSIEHFESELAETEAHAVFSLQAPHELDRTQPVGAAPDGTQGRARGSTRETGRALRFRERRD